MSDKLGILGYVYLFFSHFIKEKVPAIKNVDLFFNQFEEQEEGQEMSKRNPRCLIEINEFEVLNQIRQTQSGEMIVTLHIGIDSYSGTWEKAEAKDKNIEYLALIDEVYKQLNLLSGYELPDDLKSDLFRIYSVQRSLINFPQNVGNIKISTIEYKFIFEDHSLYTEIEETEVNEYTSTITVP